MNGPQVAPGQDLMITLPVNNYIRVFVTITNSPGNYRQPACDCHYGPRRHNSRIAALDQHGFVPERLPLEFFRFIEECRLSDQAFFCECAQVNTQQARFSGYMEKEVPQPHPRAALGLENLKPPWINSPLKSMVVLAKYFIEVESTATRKPAHS